MQCQRSRHVHLGCEETRNRCRLSRQTVLPVVGFVTFACTLVGLLASKFAYVNSWEEFTDAKGFQSVSIWIIFHE